MNAIKGLLLVSLVTMAGMSAASAGDRAMLPAAKAADAAAAAPDTQTRGIVLGVSQTDSVASASASTASASTASASTAGDSLDAAIAELDSTLLDRGHSRLGSLNQVKSVGQLFANSRGGN